MAVVVFAWFPGPDGIGHASMQGQGFYVSWWPDPDPNLRPARDRAPDGFYFSGMRAIRQSIAEDKIAERRTPDYASTPIQGLDEFAIATWWSQISARQTRDAQPAGKETRITTNGATYAVFTNNCSAMVIRGLLIGGASKNERFDYVISHNLVITPRVVRDAAETLTGAWFPMITNASRTFNLLLDAYQPLHW